MTKNLLKSLDPFEIWLWKCHVMSPWLTLSHVYPLLCLMCTLRNDATKTALNFQMKDSSCVAARSFMNAACCLRYSEMPADWRFIAFHSLYIYSIISQTFLFTPKEMFGRAIKQDFISSPTTLIDSEVICLWFDYTWRTGYSISVVSEGALHHSYPPLHYVFVYVLLAFSRLLKQNAPNEKLNGMGGLYEIINCETADRCWLAIDRQFSKKRSPRLSVWPAQPFIFMYRWFQCCLLIKGT